MRERVSKDDLIAVQNILDQKQTKRDFDYDLDDDIYEIIMPLGDYLAEIFIPYQKTEKQFYEHKSLNKLPAFNHKPKNELKKQAFIYLKDKEC